jgi:predicted permease
MLLRRSRLDRDLEEEMRLHLEMREREHMGEGATPEEAHFEARRQFGNPTLLMEVSREMWKWNTIENLFQDLRFSLRSMAKSPGFTFVAVFTLALGIGANTAIFSVMDAVLLRALPVPNPQQLFYLCNLNRPDRTSQTGDDDFSFTEYSFEQLRKQKGALSDLMAFVPLSISKVAVRYGEEPEEATADMVSGNFFSGLGVTPLRGRTLTLQDESQHAQVAVISYAYWTRRFARNADVLGQTLFIKGIPFTIIGITPPEFYGVEVEQKTEIWIPLQDRAELTAWGTPAREADGSPFTMYGTPTWWCLMMIGRVAPGATPQMAKAQLDPIFQSAAYQGLGTHDPKEPLPQVYFKPARGIESLQEGYGQPLKYLMAMVALVLVIACGNVAMLLVARNSARQREFSLRTALGAGRGRLFRQLLSESLLLVMAGAALGWIFALWATNALAVWSDFDVDLSPDYTVLLFTLAVSFAAALFFGLAPLRNALRCAPGLALKTSAANASQDRGKLRSGQIVMSLQMAMCMVLLVGAGLLVRTLRNLETADLGMEASGLLDFGITPPKTLHTHAELLQFYQALMTNLRALPGVESLTLTQNRLGSGWSNNTSAYVDGALPHPDGHGNAMRWNTVGPDYARTLGIKLALGRDTTEADTASSPKVVLVNQTFAQKFLPKLNPLGHQLALSKDDGGNIFTIVGMLADSKYTGVRESPVPMAYIPFTQIGGIGTMHFEVRTGGNPLALLPQVRQVVHQFGPDLPLIDPITQQEQFERSFAQDKLVARLALFFGLLAALLVATGLYGTLAYRVGRRTAEIGVRMALGAQRRQVLWMILRESLMVSAAGVAVGLPLSYGAARLLSSMLFGLHPGDPLAFLAALLSITLVAMITGLIPARRASSVDPMVALRWE